MEVNDSVSTTLGMGRVTVMTGDGRRSVATVEVVIDEHTTATVYIEVVS